MSVFLDEETEALVTKVLNDMFPSLPTGRTGMWPLSAGRDLGFEVRWIWDQIPALQITNYDTLNLITLSFTVHI